ncbi:MAG TPA: GGDEF domain-containing protein, partial [Rhodospirillales bacterium]|nr:GGDEF domain-containing protein [Rhodospirillales bacterium]
MADISQPAAIGAVLPADKHGQQRKRRNEEKENKPEPSESHEVSDVTEVMGIPMAEATPKVQQTLNTIMAELDKTRTDLEHARSHILYLEELADRHPVLPLTNRRGLHRELSRTLALAARAGVTNSFLCFHVTGMEDLRLKQGRQVAEEALVAVAETLVASVRDSDVVGSLGGSDLGVILTVSDDES